ncbi:MAG: alanine--tRNA ligase [Flavobacteriaceae bacterium]|nr:alanine--tRNA ligase [Flavobacteriaceae bacterium]
MTSQEIRHQFLEFFKSKLHKVVASSPIVVKNDPTLMFTNAGMNPFKDYFLGQKVITDIRVTNTQKCLRVSGKHNDLEEVGIDTYHHTMFEMLGNWSFGDPARPTGGYFKKEAIAYAWELLTEVFKIDKSSLYVTVFEGDESDNLSFDKEAFDYWKQHVPETQILNGNKKDNFWEMGAQGPCGPCSEIHVDIRSQEEKDKISGRNLVNKDHPQVVEIWNLVFIEFNRKADGSLENLPQKHIDTGMGFERLCMVMQGVKSNYDTDVFTPLINSVEKITNTKYGLSEQTDIAIRVISDHVRAVAFAIADGQLPSNTGAGYVIRRILRRAIRYGYTFLNQKNSFIYNLVDVLSEQMGENFPEIIAQKQLIKNVIKEEENSFLKTLEQGLQLLDKIINRTKGKIVSGEKAFELYDTYGFPKDLTALILRERGLSLNEADFNTAMQEQKDRSRSAAAQETADWQIISDETTHFVGYDVLSASAKITRYRKVSSKKEGTQYQLVFNTTPFYPEGGGQIGDSGHFTTSASEKIAVLDTKKENNLILHITKNRPKDVNVGGTLNVDEKARYNTTCNHSATHLLHQALREVLGTHVEQKGSAVMADYLRFDFSHFAKMTADEINQVSNFVNTKIQAQIPLKEHRSIAIKEAQKQGAMALFGEKYGDTVRMIQFADSKELCGGTHVNNTSAIWYFKITSESAIAAGVRRIEAITGEAAKHYFKQLDSDFNTLKAALKQTGNPIKAVSRLQEENVLLKRQVESLLKDKAKNLKAALKNNITTINGVNFLATTVDLEANGIKTLAFELGAEIDNLFFLAGANAHGKALLSLYISKELVAAKKLNAGTIIRELGTHIQGGGGGQAFFATAGGKNPAGIVAALKAAEVYLS